MIFCYNIWLAIASGRPSAWLLKQFLDFGVDITTDATDTEKFPFLFNLLQLDNENCVF